MTRLQYKTFINITRPAILLLLLFVQFCTDGDIGDTLFMEMLKNSTPTTITSDTTDGIYYHRMASIDDTEIIFQVGEDAVNADEAQLMDGFITFEITSNLGSIGITADRIIYARIGIWREGYNGDPAKLGTLHVDHCVTSDPTTVIVSDIYTFPLPADPSLTEFPATPYLKADMAASRTYSSYRIYYKTPKVDSSYDLVKFHSEGNTAFPYMTVWYR